MAKKKPEDPSQEPTPSGSVANLSGKHRKTLDALFARPDRSNIRWNDFFTLMKALGSDVVTGGGSAHDFELFGQILNIHRPHPGDELYKPYVRTIRGFLDKVGVTPR